MHIYFITFFQLRVPKDTDASVTRKITRIQILNCNTTLCKKKVWLLRNHAKYEDESGSMQNAFVTSCSIITQRMTKYQKKTVSSNAIPKQYNS